MADNIENLIKTVYAKYKAHKLGKVEQDHPDEQVMACFLEGKLTPEENDKIKEHLIYCQDCSRIIVEAVNLDDNPEFEVQDKLIALIKGKFLGFADKQVPYLEVIVKIKEQILELLNTNGDVLVGMELMPAPVLRSRNISDFKDEVTILKDFDSFRVEVKMENQGNSIFNIAIFLKNKITQEIIKDLRVSLIKDDIELESYASDMGKVIFDHVNVGKYIIEITNPTEKLANIVLDVKT